MPIRFEVDRASSVPAYLQLKGQVIQLVYAGRLRPNDPLPSVRELARRADVAIGTVRQAYRALELAGIVEMRVGCGTFVRALDGDAIADDQPRRRRLDTLLRDAIAQGIQLGFDGASLEVRFRDLVGQADPLVPVAFVGRTARIASWYADLIAEHLPEVPWAWRALSLDDLADAERRARDLGTVVLVFTYKGLAAEVRDALRVDEGRWEIVTVGTEVSASTRAQLAGRTAGSAVVFLAHERQGHLATVHEDLLTPPRGTLLVLTDAALRGDPAAAATAVAAADVVVATLAMEPWLETLGVPDARRRLFVLDVNAASVRSLRQRFVAPARVRG